MSGNPDYDDDEFKTWNIGGFAQCGNSKYITNKNSGGLENGTFKILYDPPKNSEQSNQFKRIYGEDDDIVKSQHKKNFDDDFHPFKTGIAKFDEQMSIRSADAKNDISSNQNLHSAQEKKQTKPPDNTFEPNNKQTENGFPKDKNTNDNNSLSTEDEIEKAFEEAYKKGFEEGRNAGYKEGFSKGSEDGYSAGKEKGEQEGHDAGFQKGEPDGYDAGFQKGEQDGKVVGDAKSLEIINSLEDVLQKAELSWHNSVKNNETKMLSLICKIAEKIVFAKVELDETIVRESILNALYTMPEPEEIILNISPDDYEYIEVVKDEFFENIKSLKSISVVSNPSINRGGCKIESSKGKVETDIKTRLEQVFSSVMGARVS